jgi:hypothetical protein
MQIQNLKPKLQNVLKYYYLKYSKIEKADQ